MNPEVPLPNNPPPPIANAYKNIYGFHLMKVMQGRQFDMNKKLKVWLQSLCGLVLVLAVLLAATFFFWLGPTVKLLAEQIGSRALGAPITIENLSINPRKGTLLLTGFVISNHDMFSHTNTVSLSEVRLAIDMDTAFSDTLVIDDILITSPHFVYEHDSVTDNITEYITNIFAFAKIDPHAPKKPKAKKPVKADDPEKEPKKVIINQLRIADVKMSVINTDDHDLNITIGLEELTLSMSNGVFQLNHLTISDPGRLSTPNIFTMESVAVDIDPASIYSDKIIVEKVLLTKPSAYYEQNSETDTVAEFMRIADSFTAKASKNPAPPAEAIAPIVTNEAAATPDTAVAPKPGLAVELRELIVDDIQFHIVNIVDPLLDVRVRLEQLALYPPTGDVCLTNLTASNPKRLATPNVFELDAITIKLDPSSLAAGTVIIEDVQVIKPCAFLEQNPETDTVSEFMKIADRMAAQTRPAKKPLSEASEKTEPEPEPTVDAEPSPPPVELHNLVVDDIQLKLLDTTQTNAPTAPKAIATIGAISVKPVEGRVQVEDITIPNPDGFHATNLFHLANIDVMLDPESLFSGQVEIRKVLVDSPEINLEQTETLGNVAQLQASLMGFVPPRPDNPDPAPEPAPAPAGIATNPPVPLAKQPIILETLLVTNLAVNAILLPPDAATTNGPSRKVDLKGLNPMTHQKKDDANKTAAVGPEEITLLAFDLLSVEPLKGIAGISNLRVGNPQGFANEHLVMLQQFTLSLNPDTLLTDTLLIKEIKIDKPSVAYERKITTDNIKVFQAMIKGAFARREETLNKAMEDHDVEAAEGEKVIIEHLLVEHGTVKAKISALPTASIPLPTIEMVDVGKEEGGASLGEASGEIFGAFYDAIIGVVANTTGIAGDALKSAGALTVDALGNLTDSLGGLVGIDEKGTAKEEQEKPEPEKKKRDTLRRRVFPR
jgi:uncharacterized protein involved in outer membrane biogenesis